MVKDMIRKIIEYIDMADDYHSQGATGSARDYFAAICNMETKEKEIFLAAEKLDELLKQLGESK